MKIAIICVMYRCTFDESETLKTLFQSDLSMLDVKLSIWNNGPQSIEQQFNKSPLIQSLKNRCNDISFYEDLSNTPLSIIYNWLIDKNSDCERFIILDHDTQLTESYIKAIADTPNKIDLILPHIEDEQTNELIAPTDNGKVVLNDGEISLNKPGSISSGLILSRNLVSIMKESYNNTVFDENFALYGIDSTFLIRVRYIAKSKNIQAVCQGYVKHSLSLSVNEEEEIKSFRSAELSYDKALTLRHYPSFGKLKTFLRDLKKIRKGESLLTTKDIWCCLRTGKHPRCIAYKKSTLNNL